MLQSLAFRAFVLATVIYAANAFAATTVATLTEVEVEKWPAVFADLRSAHASAVPALLQVFEVRTELGLAARAEIVVGAEPAKPAIDVQEQARSDTGARTIDALRQGDGANGVVVEAGAAALAPR